MAHENLGLSGPKIHIQINTYAVNKVRSRNAFGSGYKLPVSKQ